MITACSGVIFTKRDWVNVPDGKEDEAVRNEALDIREVAEIEPVSVDVPTEFGVTVNALESPLALTTLHPAPEGKPKPKGKR